MQNPGFLNYLQTLGYTGERGPEMRAYAQDLRSQGQHPRMDYWQGQHPGLGQLAGQWQGQMPQRDPGQWGAQMGNWGQPPHTMGPQLGSYPQAAAMGDYQVNGLAGLDRRMPMQVKK